MDEEKEGEEKREMKDKMNGKGIAKSMKEKKVNKIK